jgi:hypothetical protein
VTRIETWPGELARLLLAHHATAYDPATFNCATFAAEWLLRATGESIALPAVADEASASAAIAERGGLIAAVSAVTPMSPRCA